ncbi:MAG: ATP-binding cassette domain-containing protein [Anaerolineales bacterium]|nr:ATP-binding cassette domain-containing protein [Anaerolineales bacterium]
MLSEQRILVEVKNLRKFFPVRRGTFGLTKKFVRAVDDVSFVIYRGETLGLVGESGSGKTTTGRLLLRGYEPTAGSVIYHLPDAEAMDIMTMTKRQLWEFRKHAQMIFQDPYSSLNPRMTVRDIIAEPLIATKSARGEDVSQRVIETAKRCQLSIEHLRRYPHAFSGGQRQRIGIARALVLQPQFIVCDEPVSALDVSIQAQILNLLKDLQTEFGLTYLFIAHDLSVVEHICNRVGVMYLGNLVEMAATEELFYHPLHPYTEALMSSIPEADPKVKMQPIKLSGEIPSPIDPPSGCAFHPRCQYAQSICAESKPEWRELAPGHFVACHFAESLQLRGFVG